MNARKYNRGTRRPRGAAGSRPRTSGGGGGGRVGGSSCLLLLIAGIGLLGAVPALIAIL